MKSLNKSNIISFVLLFWFWFVYFISGMQRFRSVLIYSLALFPCCVNFNEIKSSDYKYFSNIFSNIMNAFSLYGIFQIFYRYSSTIKNISGLGNLIITNHMTLGYNWSNTISLFGIYVERSNAIFLEPSVFSQLIAINILHLVFGSYSKKSKIIWLIVNSIAYICTFSGTGILLLISVAICLPLLEKSINIHEIIEKNFFLFICILTFIAISSMFINIGEIIHYFSFRLSEIFDSSRSLTSGATRFRNSWVLLGDALNNNIFYGYGTVGTRALKSIGISMSKESWVTDGNAFIQLGSQYGIVGLGIYLALLFSLKPKKGFQHNDFQQIMWYSILVMNFLIGFGAFYFYFVYLMNFVIIDDQLTPDYTENQNKHTHLCMGNKV
ncbi:MAG: hypothetical protein LBU32_16090 [Clostridiales bacterium]|nr:hypothetical protein [Clostridiales bacterium]